MKIGDLSKRASIVLVVLLLVSGVMIGYGVLSIQSILVNTYSAGTIVPSLPANVTINDGLNWGTVRQGQNYTLSRVLTNTGAATGPLHLYCPLPPTPVNQTIIIGNLSWNVEGKIIPAGGTLTVVFTLQVFASANQGAFNGTVVISD